MATSVVNVGGFLGAGGFLQPFIGWQLDLGRAPGAAANWPRALAFLAGAAAFGAVASWFVREAPGAPAGKQATQT